MCKKSLLMMLLLALLVPWAAKAQTTVTIGDGTGTTYYFPIDNYFNYSCTEQIYTAEEIGTAGNITAVSFYYNYGTAYTASNVTMYMKNVDRSNFSSTTDCEALALGDIVWTGSIAPTEAGWYTFELDTPFEYDGTSNLLVAFFDGTSGYPGTAYTWRQTTSPNSAYMALRYYSDGTCPDPYNLSSYSGSKQYYTYRSNIQIEITPSSGPVCEKPETFEVSNVTTNSATLTWTGGSGTYNVEYKGGTITEWTSYLTNTTATTTTLSGLAPGKTYQARVQSVCGSDVSGWKTSANFSTACDVITTFPWTETFESYAAGDFVDPCWVNEHISGDGTYIFKIYTTTNAGNSTHQLQLPDQSSGTMTKLVLPEMNLPENYEFSIDVYRSNSTYSPADNPYEGIRVYASTNGEIEGATELAFIPRQYDEANGSIPAEPAAGWYTYELPIGMSGNCYIILRGENRYCSSTYMDNFTVKEMPSCTKPASFAKANVTAHTVDLSWTSEASAWVVAYKTADEEDFTEVPVTENPYTLTRLAPQTTYTVKVKADCGGIYSEWTGTLSFTTTIACPPPTGLATSNLTGHGATITWTAEEGAWYQSALVKTAEYDANNITWSESFEGNSQTWNNLDPVTGYTFALRKDCGSEDGYSTVVTRTFTTTVACPVPTVAVSNITTTTADVTCTNTEATAFNVQLINPNATPADTTTFANVAMPYTLTGLTMNTSYRVRVKALCGGEDGESAWSNGTNFMTAEECPDGMVCIGTGTTTSSNVPTTTCYNYSLTQQIYTAAEIGEAGAILSIDFYSTNGATKARNFDIYMVSTDKSSFGSTTDWIAVTAADLVYSATNYTWQTGWNSFELDVPFVYDGTSNVAIVVDDEKVTSYECSVNFGVFNAPSQAIYVRQDGSNYDPFNTTYTASGVLNLKNRIRLAIGEPPACPKPTGLTVNYEGGTEATISWNSDAEAWNMRVNGVDVNGVITNPYTLTGLELSTTYEVEVQANCGSDLSEWADPVSFTTDACMPEDMTVINYELADSYGDGWNGNYILVVDSECNVVEALTISSGNSASGTLKICGQYVSFMWYAGDYATETSWTFTDANGEELFSGTGTASMQTYDVLYLYDNESVKRPSDLVVPEDAIGPYGAKLSWTENGTATAWQIGVYDEEETLVNTVDANSNPFMLTGLQAETNYIVKVRSVTSAGQSAWTCPGVGFTTGVGCGAPSALDVTPYPISAIVDWASFEEGYDIEWTEVSASKDGGLWLQYDNGTYATIIGSSTSAVRTWGVMYPAAMLEGNKNLTKVSVYEVASYYTCSSYTINIYQGIDQPVTLIGTETVVPTGETGMHEITLTAPITLDLTQNLWITMTVEGTYVMSACQSTERNNQWWDNNADGVWTNMVDDNSNLAGYGWMIRGYVEGYDPADFNWISETGILPPYTIEDLSPETTYFVRVKASCGTDWIWAQFTTPSACDAPVELEATDITYNAATLNWVGYQESFNLRYRHATEGDPTAPAIIILEAHDTWGDGTGYQMLLDADATAYGVEIPESGPYTGSDYSAFEYLIPENADCDSNTENLVLDGSITLEIPAGVYDWCIINPEPGGNMWISGTGDIPGRYNDYVFEPGVTYHFTMQLFGTGDGAALEIIRPMSDWTVVENVTNPYELTGLTAKTYYEWQIQGVNPSCDGGLTEWSEIQSFTTLELTTLTQTIALNEGWNWVSFYVDITLDDLKAALIAAVPGSAITIQSKSQSTSYNPSNNRWSGKLTWDSALMYLIKVASDSEIMVEGFTIDPVEHPITVVGNGQYTYIGFPFNVSMTLTDAFAEFAVNDDYIQSKGGNSQYKRGRWMGSTLTTLEPGSGYIYKSSSLADERTLVYPSGTSKSVTVPVQPKKMTGFLSPKLMKQARVIDIDFPVKK